ncbi:MAG: hypothetical protein ABI600_09695 [Luteolibacter sp.]
MKTSPRKRWKSGFISYLLVITTGTILTLLMIYAYKKAILGRDVQKDVQLRVDYAEKEDTILRSIVAITPNRAIRAMQSGSSASSTVSDPLRWQNIFTESLAMANAGTSISSALATSLNITNLRSANTGDSALGTPSLIFAAIPPDTGYVSVGNNRSLGTGYPPALNVSDTATATSDLTYPIISSKKIYGALAQSDLNSATLNGDNTVAYGVSTTTYPNFNRLEYPQINFGYATPGSAFVAKRNWWAFSVDLADADNDKTLLALSKRNYVLSIYEIPSQLAISASSFMSLGQYASGDAWQNTTITGGIFAGKADVTGTTAISALSSRRSMALSGNSTVGGQSFADSPFTPGVRETYQLTTGSFFPVSLASESGRAAFVPINRGADFFDRLTHTTESSVLSSTTWNNYSVGALQCAMQLDITKKTSSTNSTPTEFRFSYLKAGVRTNMIVSLSTGPATGVPAGYIYCAAENATVNFGTAVVDLYYGASNKYATQTAQTGSITFNNTRFGDPIVGVVKSGYYKPSYPFEVKSLPSGKICVAVYPKRFPAFLNLLGADSTAVNSSLVVNVDYTAATGSILLTKPLIPCTDNDYGLILKECDNLTTFTKGFSIVTNLRLYIGDDFNTTLFKDASPTIGIPTGYTGTAATYYPPCSLFAPEKRYGVEVDPPAINFSGQIGSLASDTDANPVRPLDSKNSSGTALSSSNITVNLKPITHPADLPPIFMMNWLVLIEERRKEYVNY